MVLGALLAMGIPVIHMTGKGIGTASRVANTGGDHVFVRTLIMLGISGLLSFVLLRRGWWTRDWREPSDMTAVREYPAAIAAALLLHLSLAFAVRRYVALLVDAGFAAGACIAEQKTCRRRRSEVEELWRPVGLL